MIMKTGCLGCGGVSYRYAEYSFQGQKINESSLSLPFSQSHNQQCIKEVKSLSSVVRRKLIFCLGWVLATASQGTLCFLGVGPWYYNTFSSLRNFPFF